MATSLSAQSLQGECIREGRHKAREILVGVGGAVASAMIMRTVAGSPGTYSDFLGVITNSLGR